MVRELVIWNLAFQGKAKENVRARSNTIFSEATVEVIATASAES